MATAWGMDWACLSRIAIQPVVWVRRSHPGEPGRPIAVFRAMGDVIELEILRCGEVLRLVITRPSARALTCNPKMPLNKVENP